MIALLQYGFLQRALVAGMLIGIVTPLIGTYLVTRRYSLMADTLSHVALAGVALGTLAGLQPLPSAIIVSVLGAVGIETLRRRRAAQSESLLALFLSGSLALALVLLALKGAVNANLLNYLFGSITTVSANDVWTIALLSLVVILIVAAVRRPLFLLSLDEELAQSGGMRAGMYNMLLVILAAVTVSLSMRVVGILLVGALMVIPVLTAMQLTRSFRGTVLIAITTSLLSVLLGLLASLQWDLPSGATIVLVALGCFVVSMGVGRR